MAITRGKLFLGVVIALIVCLGLGFAWGASGTRELRTSVDDVKQQLDLAEARGEILDGRVSLYNNNFGDASRHFETAKAPLLRGNPAGTPKPKGGRCLGEAAISG